MTALLSADVCRLLCVHSIALLGPMLSDEAKQTSYWKAWVAHVRMLEMALRHSFSLADVTRLDELIVEHHKLFLKVSRFACYTRVTQRVTQRITRMPLTPSVCAKTP